MPSRRPQERMGFRDVGEPSAEEQPQSTSRPWRFCGIRDFLKVLDYDVSSSRFGRFFRLFASGHVS